MSATVWKARNSRDSTPVCYKFWGVVFLQESIRVMLCTGIAGGACVCFLLQCSSILRVVLSLGRAAFHWFLLVCRFSGTFRNPQPPARHKSNAGTNGRRTAVQMEAYCGTSGMCIAAFPFLQGLEASKAQRYKWGAYCGTNWRCTASTFQTSCTGWGACCSELISSHRWYSSHGCSEMLEPSWMWRLWPDARTLWCRLWAFRHSTAWARGDPTSHRPVCIISLCIYIYAVELKTGPIFAFSSVKNWSKSSVKIWSKFCFCCFFPVL